MCETERVGDRREGVMTVQKGTAKPGPSKAYVRLIEGKISSQKYAKTITRGVKTKSA